MCSRTTSAGAHGSEAVRIVHQNTEIEILLGLGDHIEEAQITLHAEYALGDDQNTSVLLLGKLRSVLELQAERLLVIVGINETLALMQTQTVDDAGVSLGVVDGNVARREQAVDDRDHTLITVVEQEGILLADKLCQFALELLVVLGLAAHGGSHTELCGTCGIGLAHLGVVGQTEVVVKAPVEHHLTAETHVGADLALQLREREISVHTLHVLADRTSCILFKSFENINHIVSEFIELYLFPFISAGPLQPPDCTPRAKPFFGNTKIAQNPKKRHFGQYLSPATTEK